MALARCSGWRPLPATTTPRPHRFAPRAPGRVLAREAQHGGFGLDQVLGNRPVRVEHRTAKPGPVLAAAAEKATLSSAN
jgi:hypothetical protein